MRINFVNEGITDEGTPDMKYYAFDWDDNIAIMPTKIILEDSDGDEVGMSTEDFAEYREYIGKKPFEYEGHEIVGFAKDPFRFFSTKGDKQFIVDSMLAKPGPAWSDFVEAINNGSIFSIVTARGHSPNVLKEACYNMIISNHNGIDSNELVKNLEKFRDLEGIGSSSKRDMIIALKGFVDYVKRISKMINKKAFLKNKVSNRFTPTIGFSDDDLRNLEKVKGHFEKDPENIIKTISTHGGIKKPY